MRLWHMLFGVFVAALLLALVRDPAGRVGVVVFVLGLGETLLGLLALMALFQTVGAIGQANRLSAYIEAVTATILVLAVATLVMNGLLWAGLWLIQQSIT